MTAQNRRRALMGQAGEVPWEDISSQLLLKDFSNGTGTSKSYNSTSNTLRVYTASNGTYRSVYHRWTSTTGYEYKAECDVSYVKGKIKLQISKENNSTIKSMATRTSSGHAEFLFSHNAEIAFFRLFVTWDTSEAGDATFSNLKLYRRPVT